MGDDGVLSGVDAAAGFDQTMFQVSLPPRFRPSIVKFDLHNIFVGKNGVGKTELIHWVRDALPCITSNCDRLGHDLHPSRLACVVRERLSQQIPTFASTHSPYVLDVWPWESIWVLQRHGDITYLRKLIEHPKYEVWKDEMLPGEFWSHVGEEWVVGTPPNG